MNSRYNNINYYEDQRISNYQPYNIWLWFILGFVTFGISDFILAFKISKDIDNESERKTSLVVFVGIWIAAKVFDIIFSTGFDSILDMVVLHAGRIAFGTALGIYIEKLFKNNGIQRSSTIKYVLLSIFTGISLPVIGATDINEYMEGRSNPSSTAIILIYIFGPIALLIVGLFLFGFIGGFLMPNVVTAVLDTISGIIYNNTGLYFNFY